MAWWLGFWAFTAVAQVQSLVGELRSRKLRGAAKIMIIIIKCYFKKKMEMRSLGLIWADSIILEGGI